MATGLSGDLLLIGKVLRPHGLGGLLRVRSYGQSETPFGEGSEILLRPLSGSAGAYKVVSATPHKDTVLLRLQGINSAEAAEELRNADIWIPAGSIPREEGEYFWHELIGLRVFQDTGGYIGDISRIIPAGGNDIYVVGRGGNETFIPATTEAVKEINIKQGIMVITPMEGLLEVNEI